MMFEFRDIDRFDGATKERSWGAPSRSTSLVVIGVMTTWMRLENNEKGREGRTMDEKMVSM